MKAIFTTTFKIWLPLGVIITCLTGFIYIAIQQNYRLSANDPQIQIAKDTVNALTTSQTDVPPNIFNTLPIDIKNSLAPFVILFSADGKPLISTGLLNGEKPTLPLGVFAYTRQHKEDRFTWQPEVGVRMAVILVYYQGTHGEGFVAAGRSLQEVEKREELLFLHTILTYLSTLAISFITMLILRLTKRS